MNSDEHIKMDRMKIFREKNMNSMNNMNNLEETQINDEKKPKKKITIVVDEDDPCLKERDLEEEKEEVRDVTFGEDPRFQQQNQTIRCFVMYTDFDRCEEILGKGTATCTWFKQVFQSICPNDWIRRWDELKAQGLKF
ncbi:cytochrome c oxidase subunit 6B1 [Apis mellifera caucasica]|uniref:Cytochrome c oxidase subunit 6B1 n=1 Tax=Apis mellifera TaxID=7460 RepID=A0A7M7GY05_APIME|nr:cytochrome c oxidase subunit 6B1 [Apis mellifera]KAG6803415.1 cytochrome c oxidase subunit 6B1 [Apis mellifera caucasica]KAG9435377.1 cytochrome c oxidase subunit 6B1 [Apis mellifera carnica]|eukprot:XP_006568940.1 cytochrome c oxidase subunit 6B1 [Apis mellifera]